MAVKRTPKRIKRARKKVVALGLRPHWETEEPFGGGQSSLAVDDTEGYHYSPERKDGRRHGRAR